MAIAETAQPSEAKLDVGRVVRNVFHVIVGQAPKLLVVGMTSVGLVAIAFEAMRTAGVIASPGDDVLAAMRGSPGENIASALASFFFTGGAVTGALAALQGREVTISEMWGACSRFFGRMLGIGFLTNLAVFVGLLLLIVPGLILWARWSAAVAVGVAEKKGVTDSMGRSARLTEGSRARIIGLLLIGVLVMVLFVAVVSLAIGVVEGLAGLDGLLVNFVAIPFFGVFLSALTSVGKAAIYEELLRIKEGGGAGRVSEVFA